MSLTTDRNNPELNSAKENGQNKAYLVLSEEEKAKGFIRPVRNSYIHKGRFYKYYNEIEILDEVYKSNDKEYIALIPALKDENDKIIGKSYLTQKDFDEINKTKGFVGGCGVVTDMSLGLAETYACDPNFYGATFCAGCGTHLGVGEFVWKGTDETVGS